MIESPRKWYDEANAAQLLFMMAEVISLINNTGMPDIVSLRLIPVAEGSYVFPGQNSMKDWSTDRNRGALSVGTPLHQWYESINQKWTSKSTSFPKAFYGVRLGI